MPTTIQTLAWRGVGLDRGPGFLELRAGPIGFAVLTGDVWQEMQALRARCEALDALNERLQAEARNAPYRTWLAVEDELMRTGAAEATQLVVFRAIMGRDPDNLDHAMRDLFGRAPLSQPGTTAPECAR